jgi:hypothetical protein
MPHKEFCGWIKSEFKMSPEQAEQFIDMAYQARREAKRSQ